LGAGSFGNVYKGPLSLSPLFTLLHSPPAVYLGIEVAIKEVLPSKEYDVAKYFEREWRLMKECRHPNICLFIGLSRAPHPDNRIFIVSEFIDNGNVRMYIHDKSKSFPWRLRLSFATDVARALAYLHARKCIHRDLKGENLLVTSNGRLKITDFGFARIAARNEEESKRLTFCGTDSYMSPEILLGDEFDLPTDVFSLGVIFSEIATRKLADDTHLKRHPPNFGMDFDELRQLASSDCPPDFLKLCMDCLSIDPSARPTTRDILERLRLIEVEVLARPNEVEDAHVGSIKFLPGGKRHAAPPRIPSFKTGVGNGIAHSGDTSDESGDELKDAVEHLSTMKLNGDLSTVSDGTFSAHFSMTCSSDQCNADQEPSIATATASSIYSDYSTTVIRSNPKQPTSTLAPSLSSILTVRPSPDLTEDAVSTLPTNPTPPSASPLEPITTTTMTTPPASAALPFDDPLGSSSILSIASLDSYHTAASVSSISSARATEGGSTVRSLHGYGYYGAISLMHRFTLLKPGIKQKRASGSFSAPNGTRDRDDNPAGWSLNPLDLFFSSGLLINKCDVCNKRFRWKPVLECDDCGLRFVFLYDLTSSYNPPRSHSTDHTSNAARPRREIVEPVLLVRNYMAPHPF